MEVTASSLTLAPRLLDYEDYRAYLRDYYAYRKKARAGFSFRAFAARAGLKSPNYLQLVMQGKRNFTTETAAKVASAMGLKGDERQLFLALVEKDLAGTSPEQTVKARGHFFAARKKVASRLIPADQREVLARWYHLVVRELVVLPDFVADAGWISRRLGGTVSAAEVEASLAFLVRTGFLKLDAGRLVQSEPNIDTGDAFSAPLVLNYHQNTLSAWIRVLARLDTDERELGLLNIPMKRDKLPELKRRMRAFQDEIIGWLQDEKEPDCLAQLGTYLVPLTVELTAGLEDKK